MLAWIGYRIADLMVGALPLRIVRGLARRIARLVFVLRPPARAILERNLALLAPGSDPRVLRDRAREAFENFALSIADFAALARTRPEELAGKIEIRGAEHLAAARATHRGVIVLSAHAGNWEWGAAWLATLGERVHVAARRHPSRRVEALYCRRRRSLHVSRLRGRSLWLAASRALRRREWVAVMGDRDSPDLHGSLCAWARALARRTGAVILPAVMLRLADGRHAACFEPPLDPMVPLGAAYRDAMRRRLETEPGQWCAFEPLPEALAAGPP
jgi:KDO2-lipid IV(A) lauroyltransferase